MSNVEKGLFVSLYMQMDAGPKKSPDAAGFESSLTFVPSTMIFDDGKYSSSYGHQITSLLFH